MERVHQLLAQRNLAAENDAFWCKYWPHIASAKVSLETKVTACLVLRHRGVANVNELSIATFCEMLRADRAFVAELDLSSVGLHCYRLCTMCLDDDVEALARYCQEMRDGLTFSWRVYNNYYPMKVALRRVLIKITAPRCLRFLLQDTEFREVVTLEGMTPLVQRLVEELVQSTDQLHEDALLLHGQSVKLIGMCVNDEELVVEWLNVMQTYAYVDHVCT
jgi:hypothetical protein